MASKRPRTEQKALRVTPIYESHPEHSSEPLIYTQLPVTLGRQELCELWWMNCPFQCKLTPANSSDYKDVCEKYCHNIRKVVNGSAQGILDADDDSLNDTRRRRRRRKPQHNYELLSRRAIHVSKDEKCKIIASHKQFFQLKGRLATKQGVHVRVAGLTEVWMRFQLELVEQYSGTTLEKQVSIKQMNDLDDDVSGSEDENSYNTQNTLEQARRLLRDPWASECQSTQKQTGKSSKITLSLAASNACCDTVNASSDGWLHATVAPNRSKQHRRYQLQLTDSSVDSSGISSQSQDNNGCNGGGKTLGFTKGDSPARRNLFSDSNRQVTVHGASDSTMFCRKQAPTILAKLDETYQNIGDIPRSKSKDYAIASTESGPTSVSVVRRDLVGAPPVNVVTPDLMDAKRMNKRILTTDSPQNHGGRDGGLKLSLSKASSQAAAFAPTPSAKRLKVNHIAPPAEVDYRKLTSGANKSTSSDTREDERGAGGIVADEVPPRDDATGSQLASHHDESQSRQTRASSGDDNLTKPAMRSMPSLSFLLDSFPASHRDIGSNEGAAATKPPSSVAAELAQRKVPARKLLRSRRPVVKPADNQHLTMESMLDMKLEASYDSRYSLDRVDRMIEQSQAQCMAAPRCIGAFTYRDWLKERDIARLGSYRRAVIDAVLSLNEGTGSKHPDTFIKLPDLLCPDTVWTDGDDYV
ncbi:hypothetical protein MPSEU_000041100 [Mayamaea pseudoterrestris]|nr:hypothetical protein MPSEU_000041100 [Mayamaea pseudoterrestris]